MFATYSQFILKLYYLEILILIHVKRENDKANETKCTQMVILSKGHVVLCMSFAPFKMCNRIKIESYKEERNEHLCLCCVFKSAPKEDQGQEQRFSIFSYVSLDRMSKGKLTFLRKEVSP